jgi:hypothetical protein
MNSHFDSANTRSLLLLIEHEAIGDVSFPDAEILEDVL